MAYASPSWNRLKVSAQNYQQASPIGILAGSGALPRMLIEGARRLGRPVFIIAFKDFCDAETVADHPHCWVRLGAAGEIINALKQAGCRDIVMGGAIRRPSYSELRPDWRGTRFLLKSGVHLLGDDGLLKAVRHELEEVEGFKLLSVADVIQDLITADNLHIGPCATAQAQQDIARGISIIDSLSQQDVGQAVVVQQGLVLAIEAIEGTAAMLQRAGELKRNGEGGVLVKFSKLGQDKAVDLPTIGPATVDQAIAAGLSGICIEAEASLILEYDLVEQKAQAANIFIISRKRNRDK